MPVPVPVPVPVSRRHGLGVKTGFDNTRESLCQSFSGHCLASSGVSIAVGEQDLASTPDWFMLGVSLEHSATLETRVGVCTAVSEEQGLDPQVLLVATDF